jgi:hypothetical protein
MYALTEKLVNYIELNHALTTNYRYSITSPGSYVVSTDLLAPVVHAKNRLLRLEVGLPVDYLDDDNYLDDNYLQAGA